MLRVRITTETMARAKISRAYAICRSSLQKSHRYKSGTADLTKVGAKKSQASGRKKDNKSKVTGFERLLKRARE